MKQLHSSFIDDFKNGCKYINQDEEYGINNIEFMTKNFK
jgi:hypothetical protein